MIGQILQQRFWSRTDFLESLNVYYVDGDHDEIVLPFVSVHSISDNCSE